MKNENPAHHLWVLNKVSSTEFQLEGDLNPTNIDVCCLAIKKISAGCSLNLLDLDIDDGPCLAVFISALRCIAPCTLVGAPRMLAHTLYKINARDITLVHPRSY